MFVPPTLQFMGDQGQMLVVAVKFAGQFVWMWVYSTKMVILQREKAIVRARLNRRIPLVRLTIHGELPNGYRCEPLRKAAGRV